MLGAGLVPTRGWAILIDSTIRETGAGFWAACRNAMIPTLRAKSMCSTGKAYEQAENWLDVKQDMLNYLPFFPAENGGH